MRKINRFISCFLFICITSSGCTQTHNETKKETFKWNQLYPNHVDTALYPIVIKAELQEVFLNGGMCGHKVFKVIEVIKGNFTDSYFSVFICNLVTYKDYYKSVLVGGSIDTSTISQARFGYPANRIDQINYDQLTRITIPSIKGLIEPLDTSQYDYPDLSKTSPIEFLNYLRNFRLTCMVIDRTHRQFNWVKKEHIDTLVKLLDSKEPAIPVYESYNVDGVQYASTIGNEALYMLESYQEGVYPPNDCSLGYWGKEGEKISDFESRKKIF